MALYIFGRVSLLDLDLVARIAAQRRNVVIFASLARLDDHENYCTIIQISSNLRKKHFRTEITFASISIQPQPLTSHKYT